MIWKEIDLGLVTEQCLELMVALDRMFTFEKEFTIAVILIAAITI